MLLAGPAYAESLQDACKRTLEQHPALLSDQAVIRAAQEGVSAARSGFFPSVKLDSELNSDNFYRPAGNLSLFGRAGGLEADQMIFDGFRTSNALDAADAERQALEADYLQNTNTVLLATVRSYLAVLRDREMLTIAQRNLDEHRRSVSRVAAIVKYDAGKEFDLVQVRAREAYAASMVTERAGALKASEAQYRELVGREAGALTKPESPAGEGFASLDEALTVGQREHPAVKSALERLKRRKAEKEQANGVLWPRVDLTARYIKGMDRQALMGSNDEAYAGLRASYSIPTGGAMVSNIRNASELQTSAELKVEAAKRDAREAVRVSWAQRESLAATMPPVKEHLMRSNQVLDGYKTQYTLGRRTILEMLIVQNESYLAESRLISLQYDRLLADFTLAAEMGTLRVYLAPKPKSEPPIELPSLKFPQK